MTDLIGYDDFLKVDVRVGRILAAEVFKEARRPAYKLVIDFGPEIGERPVVGADHRELQGGRPRRALVLGVVNFPPKQIGRCVRKVLTLGVPDAAGHVCWWRPTRTRWSAAVFTRLG
jgi:EMAP domain